MDLCGLLAQLLLQSKCLALLVLSLSLSLLAETGLLQHLETSTVGLIVNHLKVSLESVLLLAEARHLGAEAGLLSSVHGPLLLETFLDTFSFEGSLLQSLEDARFFILGLSYLHFILPIPRYKTLPPIYRL